MAIERGQIQFFNKNIIDLESNSIGITITDAVASSTGQDFVDFLRDRKNYTVWGTAESTDAAGTVIDFTFGDLVDIDSIFLVGHNLKDYQIEYWTGLVWSLVTKQLDNTTVAPTNDTNSTSFYLINKVNTDKLRITVDGTQVVDDDKILKQIIITERIGKLTGWPLVKKPTIDTQKKRNKMLSGKSHIIETLESFSCTLDVRHWSIQDDIDIVEEIYAKRQGVLLWLNSDTPEQFKLTLKGWRKEDIPLVRPLDNYTPEMVSGIYTNGIKTSMRLIEVIT